MGKFAKVKILWLLITFCAFNKNTFAQCPPNIDFELGNFSNWECRGGTFNGTLNLPAAPAPPIPGRHDMYSLPPGNGNDLYGGFPKNCPNGSGYSVRIGNQSTGRDADEISYTFTIPAGQNTYNLIYHYAIVLNDANNSSHPPNLQPRFIIAIQNITDNTILPCAFPAIVVSGGLPGFLLSAFPGSGNTPVYYKDWAAASIKLDNLAGKTIRISYTVTGCGLNNGSHFGYAYVDMNSTCSSAFTGATYCPDDAFVNVTAPSGYQSYAWWDIADPSVILGTSQIINFTPPPPSGTVLQVALTPFAGYGCNDTLTASLWDTLTVIANAGPDRLSCQNVPVQLGLSPSPGLIYSWSPVTDLSDPNISNPIATPSVSTTYVLSVTNAGGGCLTTDTVQVNAAVLDNTLIRTGITTFCLGDPQAAILEVAPADSIQWYLNNVAIPGANQTQYNVVQTGTYHATVFSFTGCFLTTLDEVITVYEQPVAGFTMNTTEQCFNGHVYNFTNTSTIVSGLLQYNWDLGDGNTSTSTNVTHSYAVPGTYTVKLIVTSDNGCIDSISFNVKVKISPLAGFNILPTEQCYKNNEFIFTSTSTVSSGDLLYRWYMGDGTVISSSDVIYSYAIPGTYNVKLLVFSDDGCVDSTDFDVNVNPIPVAGFTVNNTQQCLDNNQFIFTNTSTVAWGNLQYVWNLGDGTIATTTNVTHQYNQPGSYNIKMLVTSDKGCTDSSTFQCKYFSNTQC